MNVDCSNKLFESRKYYCCGDLKFEMREWESEIWDYDWICFGFYMVGVGIEVFFWMVEFWKLFEICILFNGYCFIYLDGCDYVM